MQVFEYIYIFFILFSLKVGTFANIIQSVVQFENLYNNLKSCLFYGVFHKDVINNRERYLLSRRHNPERPMALTDNRWSGYMFHTVKEHDFFQSRL